MTRLSLAPLLFFAGCLTHLPPRGHDYLRVHWARDYASAAREAAGTGQPMLLCLIAGELDGPC